MKLIESIRTEVIHELENSFPGVKIVEIIFQIQHGTIALSLLSSRMVIFTCQHSMMSTISKCWNYFDLILTKWKKSR
jgi:hypothetical protein